MKKYDSYKDSGVEWIGEIPSHWCYSNLKWYSEIYSGGTPSKDIDEYWINGTIPWLNSGSVNQGDVEEVSEYITEEALNNSSAKWIPEGSLIMALAGQGKTKGMVAQVKFKTTCNQSLGVIVPNEKINNRFLLYWLRNNYQNIRNLGGGDKRDGLNLVMLGGIPTPIPDYIEQTIIANFLDHKTAQIDDLISKKERLIQLLEEERTTIINQAVTKGLDPNVPMKDSGIEWLGEVPEHWEVKPIKYLLKDIQGGGTPSTDNPEFWNGDIPWISPKDMKSYEIDKSEDYITSLAVDNSSVKLIDSQRLLMVVRSGILKHTLPLAINTNKVTVNQDIKALSVGTEIITKYFFWLLHGTQNIILTLCSKIGATVDSIEMERFKNHPIPVPTIEEQQKIIEFIEKKIDQLSKSSENMRLEIKLIDEYKTALISEVVTGKVDVRNVIINERI